MNLYLISQSAHNDYDTHDSAVVCAPNEEIARHMNPSTGDPMEWNKNRFTTWCYGPEQVNVQFIGIAEDSLNQGVICASFNAG